MNINVGELNADTMNTTGVNPATRNILNVTYDNAEKMINAFKMWFDTEVTDRKNILENELDKYDENNISLFTSEKGNIKYKNVEDIVNDNMLIYSNYVIKDRALPDLRDGMKPVHRRILTTLNMNNGEKLSKSRNVTGNVSKIHPHGDTYQTVVGMVQEDNNITPFISGKGTFGQHTSKNLKAAADRYTEIKLSDAGKEVFKDIKNDVVDYIDNYDETIKIPSVLPISYPSILHITQKGIAVGMACNFASFNLIDINNLTINYLKTGLFNNVLIPDFATGGKIIKDELTFKKINEEGTGTIKLRGNIYIEDNCIYINEIPHNTTRESILEDIYKAIKTKKITEISNIHDLTGLNQMLIKIKLKRNADINTVINKLYLYSPLESTFSINMNMLVGGLPKVLGTYKTIKNWIEWRINCIKRKYTKIYKELNVKYILKSSLIKIKDNTKEVVEIILNSDNVITDLMERFELNEEQAEYIQNLRLKALNKKNLELMIKDIKELHNSLIEAKNIMQDEEKQKEIIINELNEINKKFGKDRKTKIVEVDTKKIKNIIKQEIKKDNNKYVISITQKGYIYKTLKKDYVKLHTGDEIIQVFEDMKEGNQVLIYVGIECYKVYVEDLKVVKNEYGILIKNVIGLDFEDLKITKLTDDTKFILIEYDNNKIAKINSNSFKTSTKRTKLSNSAYDKANIVNLYSYDEDITLLIKTKRTEKEINTTDILTKGTRNTQGINVNGCILEVK